MTKQEKVSSGFKQSEIGMIPEDWDLLPAEEICELVVDCKNRTPPVVEGGEYAVARTPNVKNGVFVYDDLRFTDAASFETWTARAIPEFGDVLITREAPLGEVCLVPKDLKLCLGQRMMMYRPDPRKTVSDYLLCALLSEQVQKNLRVKIGGSTVGHAKVDDIRFLKVPVPPTLAEQRAIAEALSDADARIAALEALIAKKRDLKQAAMQQLLTGKTRLPGFSGEWEVKPLGEIGEVSGAGVDKKVREGEQSVRLVNYMDAYRRTFIQSSNLDHWVTAPQHQARRCTVEKGDVFFTPSSETRDDIANSAVAMENIPDAAYSYHVVRLRIKDHWDLQFRAYAFQTRDFLDQAQMICDGSGTRYVISLAKFRGMTVKVPEVKEQAAIAEILSDMDAELAALDAEAEKARTIKQGMMQNLLTGKVRLV